VREATPDDAPAIARLHAESWRTHYRGAYTDEYLDGPVYEERADTWRSRLDEAAPNQFIVVAERDGELVGFACAYGADDDRWGTLLDNLHVRTDLHRSGIGRRLVAEIARFCRERYAGHGLYLWVLAQNTNAREFYARIGGEDVGGEHREPSAGAGRVNEVRRIAWSDPGRVAILNG
jgi:ribosomal protein S18 acetylase RimI-like enzyme